MADETWCKWLEDCANGKSPGCSDPKIQSYARATLLNIFCNHQIDKDHVNKNLPDTGVSNRDNNCPRYKDMVFLINPELPHWKCPEQVDQDNVRRDKSLTLATTVASDSEGTPVNTPRNDGSFSSSVNYAGSQSELPLLDVVFVHGIRGGAYRSWRIAEDKTSTTSGLVEKIDEEAGKLGTFWPGEWLSSDIPQVRMFTLKYKVCFESGTNLKGSCFSKRSFWYLLPLAKFFDKSLGNFVLNSLMTSWFMEVILRSPCSATNPELHVLCRQISHNGLELACPFRFVCFG